MARTAAPAGTATPPSTTSSSADGATTTSAACATRRVRGASGELAPRAARDVTLAALTHLATLTHTLTLTRRVRPSSLRDHGRRLCLRPGPVRRRHETGPPHPRCRWHPRKTAASYSGWCCCPPFGATASCRARCTSRATRAPFASAAWTLGGSRLAGCGRTLASLGSEASSRPRSTPSCSS